MDFQIFFALLISSFVGLHDVRSNESPMVESFDVKPGGNVHSFEKQHGPFKCMFVYTAQGGTHERWEMTVEADRAMYSCTVARPQGASYLFFQNFILRLTGASLLGAEAFGNNDRPLQTAEFILDQKQNEVRSSPNDFRSQMARLKAFASAEKTEL